MSCIELQDLYKRFGSVQAVAGVSLAVREGELLALVGPSGCGKTTLLRLIAGFERPDSGEILFGGRSILGQEPQQRRVGIVFQDYALFPHMSVRENIAYGLKFVPLTRRERVARVAQLLHLMGLSGLERRAPEELSAGQQQRVALARALAPRPRILLLDEPLSALDAQLRETLRLEIKRLQGELGVTTVHVTHDQEEALAIADRVAVMQAGRLEQLSSPQELYHRPQTEFVARFIGRGNLLPGTVVQSEPDQLIVRLEGATRTLVQVSTGDATSALPPVGAAVRLLLRPERISLGDDRANRLECQVESLEFLGEISRLHLRCGAQELIAQLPSGATEHWQQHIGRRITLSFDPQDVWPLPPSS